MGINELIKVGNKFNKLISAGTLCAALILNPLSSNAASDDRSYCQKEVAKLGQQIKDLRQRGIPDSEIFLIWQEDPRESEDYFKCVELHMSLYFSGLDFIRQGEGIGFTKEGVPRVYIFYTVESKNQGPI